MIHPIGSKYDGYGPDGRRLYFKGGGGGGQVKYDNLERLYQEQADSARLLRAQAEQNLPGAVDSYVGNVKAVQDPNYANRQAGMAGADMAGANSSGVQGVCFHRATGKWSSSIQAGKKRYHLGVFGSKEEAGEAYRRAKLELHEFSPLIRGEHDQQKGASV